MDYKKIAFIIAVTNNQYYEECVYYIKRIIIPSGYSVDIHPIYNAKSMCSAYNQVMKKSDAKYKIYLHQDVFIRNENFLFEILKIFQNDKSIGMIGMLGGNRMPKTGMAFCSWNEGVVHAVNPDLAYLAYGSDHTNTNIEVEAVDGLLIATQYDILWREDLFHDFDFYDVSQSFEMRKAQYKVIIPYQKIPWTIHDSSFIKLKKYDENREKCLKEYPDFFYAEDSREYSFNEEWNILCNMLGEKLTYFISGGEWNNVKSIIDAYRKYNTKDTLIEVCGIISDIYCAEQATNQHSYFLINGLSFEQMYKEYTKFRFLLRRIEMGLPQSEYVELFDSIKERNISCRALIIIVIHSTLYKKEVLVKLENYYKKIGYSEEAEYVRKVYKLVDKCN